MPYLIETYKPGLNGAEARLIDINVFVPYDTKEAANEAISALLDEQTADNESLLADYTNRLELQVMDMDTDDRIHREPTLYNYFFKAVKYSNRRMKQIPA